MKIKTRCGRQTVRGQFPAAAHFFQVERADGLSNMEKFF